MRNLRFSFYYLALIACLLVVGTACGRTSATELLDLIRTPTPMPTALPTAAATAVPDTAPYSLVGFEMFIIEAENSRLADRQALINDYMAQVNTAPLIDEQHAVFLWQGSAQTVHLHGDMNNWITEQSLPLTHIEATDLWYLIFPAEAAARLDYQFIIDTAQLTLDPLNPHQIVSAVGNHSVLKMGEYVTPPEILPPISPLTAEQRGDLTTHTIDSEALGQTRTIVIYTPAADSALPDGRYPAVYIQDGSDYLNRIDTSTLLDRLIAAGEIPPLVAVFIPPVNRYAEYDHDISYVNFLAEELIPFTRRTAQTSTEANQTALLGSDMGGLLAVYAAQTRPDLFGLVSAQSGTFTFGQNKVIRQVALQEPNDVRYHLIVGSYETAVGGKTQEGNLLEGNRQLQQALQRADIEHSYAEYPEGHSWGFWQAHIGDALRYLFAE